jgi:VIT1/CCC1 family predicted Fe2+/Mn2+ transporter
MEMIALVTLASLAGLGALGGKLGGAPMLRASLRVTLGGAIALAVTFGIGRVLGLTL